MTKSDIDKEYKEFKENYKKEVCYLCSKPFNTLSSENPCLHSLLRRNKFKHKQIKKIYEKYDYHQLSTFLKWCANEELYLKNINNLKEEKSQKKILSYTIKWKNIEWTFDCSPNDLTGHQGTNTEYPHYHFQMKIDGRIFIKFNSYHLPFSENDIFLLSNESKITFFSGSGGFGMQEAMDALEEYPELAEENNNIYSGFSMVFAKEGEKINGDDIQKLYDKSIKTGKRVSHLLQKENNDDFNVRTIISPSENIPDIANRTEHKKKS